MKIYSGIAQFPRDSTAFLLTVEQIVKQLLQPKIVHYFITLALHIAVQRSWLHYVSYINVVSTNGVLCLLKVTQSCHWWLTASSFHLPLLCLTLQRTTPR